VADDLHTWRDTWPNLASSKKKSIYILIKENMVKVNYVLMHKKRLNHLTLSKKKKLSHLLWSKYTLEKRSHLL
jgi:hypothetical protein